MENIILTGMRGTGKSSIGRLLAEKLDREFVEMDALIEDRAGKSIKDIVDDSGWDVFREMEHQLSKELSERESLVISTGGGTMVFERNVEVLKPTGRVVLFTCAIEESARRIYGDENRPSLTGGKSAVEELAEVWDERKAKYREVADIIYATDNGKLIAEQVEELIAMID